MHMFQNLIDKLKAHPRKIVFTEGTDPASWRHPPGCCPGPS